MRKRLARGRPGGIPGNFSAADGRNDAAVLADFKKAARRASGRLGPTLLTVKDAFYLTPNMIRVFFAGPDLDGFPIGCQDGNCKLVIPDEKLASRPGR